MAYRSLRDFIARLEAVGELVRVKEPVSTFLEMTEIQTRLIAEGGPAVLFEKPAKEDGTPSAMPVLVNLFGTVKRVAMGVTMDGKERTEAKDLREVGELLAQLRQPQPPRSFGLSIISDHPTSSSGSCAIPGVTLRRSPNHGHSIPSLGVEPRPGNWLN